jgi:hypothetical protein
MKKVFFLLAGATFILASCNSKSGGMSDRAKKNAAASDIVADAIQSGDTSKINDAVADNFVDHTDMGDKNRDSLKSMVLMSKEHNSDMKLEKKAQTCDDEWCMTWYHFSGNSNGEMGMPKGPYDMNTIEVVKFNADSKAIEHWSFVSMAETMKMMQQMGMGGMPDSNHMAPTMKDTAK